MNKETLNNSIIKHRFFMDVEAAYIEAEKKNVFIDTQGNEQIQYCYYDGPLTEITLTNFIKVEQSQFVDFFSNNQLPIPTLIVYADGNTLDLDTSSPDIIDEINHYRENLKIQNYIHTDNYYIDPLKALNTAKQNNRVNCGHPTIDGLQLCFYNGESIKSNITNYIPVPFTGLMDFFVDSRFRVPTQVVSPEGLDDDIKKDVLNSFNNALSAVIIKQKEISKNLYLQAKELKPDFNETRLRVFLPTNRLTQVMKYSTKGIAKAFEKIGYETFIHMETNDMECLNQVSYFKAYLKFKPHITVNINHLSNHYLHQDVINIVWWQDPITEIQQKEKLPWRNNDIVFVYGKLQQELVSACGKSDFIDQPMCIDEEVFFNDTPDSERDNKIVFIGSSYHPHIMNFNNNKIFIEKLIRSFERGKSFTKKVIKNLSDESGISLDDIPYIINYVVRDTSIQWLCSQDIIPFELYGRNWDYEQLLKTHNRGEISHGSDVADIYRKAKYALVNLPWSVESQRLAEIIACGCIPIVYDARDYDNYSDEFGLNYYKTKTDLFNLLESHESLKFNLDLPKKFTYLNMVLKCHEIIDKKITKSDQI